MYIQSSVQTLNSPSLKSKGHKNTVGVVADYVFEKC